MPQVDLPEAVGICDFLKARDHHAESKDLRKKIHAPPPPPSKESRRRRGGSKRRRRKADQKQDILTPFSRYHKTTQNIIHQLSYRSHWTNQPFIREVYPHLHHDPFSNVTKETISLDKSRANTLQLLLMLKGYCQSRTRHLLLPFLL